MAKVLYPKMDQAVYSSGMSKQKDSNTVVGGM
jgi:hypothetical protein